MSVAVLSLVMSSKDGHFYKKCSWSNERESGVLSINGIIENVKIPWPIVAHGHSSKGSNVQKQRIRAKLETMLYQAETQGCNSRWKHSAGTDAETQMMKHKC